MVVIFLHDLVDSDFIYDINAPQGLYRHHGRCEAMTWPSDILLMLISNHGNLYLQSSSLNKALMMENPK
jgi:hypothetical protein